MTDSKKVLNDLQELCEYLFNQYKYCCKGDEEETYNRFLIANNALNLLKQQEAVTIKKTKEHAFGVYGGICPKCKNWIQSAHSYCGFCGQAVKWDA